jgi:hypothetical protein
MGLEQHAIIVAGAFQLLRIIDFLMHRHAARELL